MRLSRAHKDRRPKGGKKENMIALLKWDILALYLARKDPALPMRSKLLVALAVGYALSPIDLIPDFIPVLGYLDDIVIVPALVAHACRALPPELLADYKRKARREFASDGPKAWLAGIIVVAFWAAVLLTAALWLRSITG